jgi:3',5'-cyclic AMP phosphodiesterase CpdA
VTLRFAQITDHHLAAGDLLWGYSTGHALRSVLRHIAERAGPLDFIVSTGDLVEHGADAEYRAFLELIGAEPSGPFPGPLIARGEGLGGMPFYALPGNHDVRPAMLRGLFPASPPAERLQGWFERGGIRFVCVDWGPGNKAVSSPDQGAFLDATLGGGPTIVLMHHHVTPVGHGRLDQLIADDVASFAERIAGRGVLAILSGHTHATFESRLAGVSVYGLRSTCFQFATHSQDELLRCLQPPHYRVITIADGALTSEVVEVPL